MTKELIVILLGAAPISEVRGAIPVAMLAFDMPAIKAYALAVLGNIIPIIPLFVFLSRFVESLMRRSYLANRFFTWLFERTRRRHGDHFHHWKWAPLALFIFVAIPLPFTGAWSGVVAAFVFGMPLWISFVSIALGAIAAGGIVLGLTSAGLLTAQAIFQLFK